MVLFSLSGIAVAFVVNLGFGVMMASGTFGFILYSAGPSPVAGQPPFQWYWTGVYFSLNLALHGRISHGLVYLVSTCMFMGIGETIAKDLQDLENDRAGLTFSRCAGCLEKESLALGRWVWPSWSSPC